MDCYQTSLRPVDQHVVYPPPVDEVFRKSIYAIRAMRNCKEPSKINWKFITLAGMATAVVGGLVFWGLPRWMRRRNWIRKVVTRVIDRFGVQPQVPVYRVRSVFKNTVMPAVMRTSEPHTHPDSAAVRSSTSTFAMSVAGGLGLEVFMEQASNADVKQNLAHNRVYYWAKDLTVPSKIVNAKEAQLRVIVDVDYYMDMAKDLLAFPMPTMLYSLQPKTVADVGKDYNFTFNSRNEIVYSVDGGAKFVHQIWNYSIETFIVRDMFDAVVYQVERLQADKHHEFVMLIPVMQFKGIFASWLSRWLEADTLARLTVNQGNYNVLEVQGGGLNTSISKVGEYACATIPTSLLQTVFSASNCTQVKAGVASVQSWLEENGGRVSAATVCEYLLSNPKHLPARVYRACEGILKYHLLRQLKDIDVDAPPLMSPYMNAVLPRGYVPVSTTYNEAAAVVTRVLLPATEIKNTPANDNLVRKYMDEFIKLLIPDEVAHCGHPTEVSTVYEKQSRPTQQSLLNRASAMAFSAKPFLNTFLKAEPYQKAGDPRVISTYATVDKREYSRLIYSFAEYIVKQKWYTFGKTPVEIANTVADICSKAKAVVCADANKMDGHISGIIRELELAILLRFFSFEHHSNVAFLHGRQYHADAATRMFVKYFVEFMRGSGSAETALFNTIVSKFIDYVYRRQVQSPQDAFNAPGIFGGDDSLADAGHNPDGLVKAAAMVGQVYEVEVYKRGEYGVNYLSRFYTSDVWFGDNNSTCDIVRQLSKLHIAGRDPDVLALTKLQRKLSGLRRTDYHTPVIREILSAALRCGMDLSDSTLSDSWWAQYDINTNWPNAEPRDVGVVLEKFLPGADVSRLFSYLRTCRLAGLIAMPSIDDVGKVKHNPRFISVVEDEVQYPVPEVARAVDQVVCRHFLAGRCTRRNCRYPHVPRLVVPGAGPVDAPGVINA